MKTLALLVALTPGLTAAQDFPQRFDSIFGTTVVEARPERVVSLGYVAHDDLLALGVIPVALRYWYGPYPGGVWPWAQAALGEARPEVLRGEISFERIALLEPDLILAVSSGVSAQEYRMLSRMAPTIASEPRFGDYNTPWDELALTVGRAVGQEPKAQAQIDAIRARFAAIRADHPEWGDMTAVAATYSGGAPAVFLPGDTRADVLNNLGFKTPEALAQHAGESFYMELSAEDLTPLDADVVLWIGGTATAETVASMPLRPSMRAPREGREVWADELMAGALGHATLLSLPWVLDHIVPEIEAAADGDPATPVPSALAAGLVR